ncbi:MAG TPA: type VI secretion system tube protein TssD [Hymenobacter sp.]|jgi:hypothetical protein
MASLAAALHVNGRVYPVRKFTAAHHQDTHERGYVTSSVRPGPVELTLDVAVQDTFLPGWAYDPFRHYEANILCRDADGGSVTHTLHLPQAYCVGYDEHFLAGDTGGSFQCQVTLVAPDGWRVIPGAPGKFVTPAARDHGSPPAASLVATALLKAEELATGMLKKVVTPAGNVATEFLGVGLAAIARTASLTAGLLLTPTNSRDDPGYASEWEMYRRNMQHGTPLTPDQLRLAQLERLHEQDDLKADEEAEMIAILAKVKGIHIQKLSDLAVDGPLRGNPVPLPGFHNIQLNYTKRSTADLKALRDKFDTSARKEFLKKLSNDPQAVQKLKNAGLSSGELQRVAAGKVPNLEWQVHHKLPLDDGGDNSFDNLLLIKNDPYHKAITNLQNAATRGMQPGETRVLLWPVCLGSIYPN